MKKYRLIAAILTASLFLQGSSCGGGDSQDNRTTTTIIAESGSTIDASTTNNTATDSSEVSDGDIETIDFPEAENIVGGAEVCSNFSLFDGPDGNQYRPESNSDGNAVFVLAAQYLNSVQSVCGDRFLFDSSDGKQVSVGETRDCCQKQPATEGESGRPIYRCSAPGDEYSGEFELVLGAGQVCSLQAIDPSVEIE